jgi:hypothetical protein
VIVDIPEHRHRARCGPHAEHVHLEAVGMDQVGSGGVKLAPQPRKVECGSRRAQRGSPERTQHARPAGGADVAQPRERRRIGQRARLYAGRARLFEEDAVRAGDKFEHDARIGGTQACEEVEQAALRAAHLTGGVEINNLQAV